MTQPLSPWEEAYHDWRDLLERADATDLIHDPKAVWDEAWRQALVRANLDIQKRLEELMKC